MKEFLILMALIPIGCAVAAGFLLVICYIIKIIRYIMGIDREEK